METVDRGGYFLGTGKVGYPRVLRQQLLLPGETQKTTIQGEVQLEATRQAHAPHIHCRIDSFATPWRWLWSDSVEMIREGPTSTKRPPYASDGAKYEGNALNPNLGIGRFLNVREFWVDHIIKIYNEHYKWPEDDDITVWGPERNPAIPLSMPWNRLREDNIDDVELDVSSDIDIQDIAELTAQFRSSMSREFLNFDRFLEITKARYGKEGSREVDQVPMHVDSTEGHVNPQTIRAMDSPGLGEAYQTYRFNIDHHAPAFTAHEHMVLATIMTVRFASITENDCNYQNAARSWIAWAGDPDIMAAAPLENVRAGELAPIAAGAQLGWLPAGWQLRTRWNVVEWRISRLRSFPLYRALGNTIQRSAAYIRDAFRSTTLGDMTITLQFHTKSHMPFKGGVQLGTGQRVDGLEPDRLV